MYFGKDTKYEELHEKLITGLCSAKNDIDELHIIKSTLIELLMYLDKLETKRHQPTMD